MTVELTMDGYVDFDEFTVAIKDGALQIDFLMDGQTVCTQTTQMGPNEVYSVQGIIGYLKFHFSAV